MIFIKGSFRIGPRFSGDWHAPPGTVDLCIEDANGCRYCRFDILVKDLVSAENEKQWSHRLYPNPAQSEVLLQSREEFKIGTQIRCLDLSGKEYLLPQKRVDSRSMQLDIRTLPKGEYLIQWAGKTREQYLKLTKG